MTDELPVWDVAVIGGGPAGMMAAGRASLRGLKVLLIEKNDSLGKKLLITGGGRCNVTNAELDTRKLLAKFKSNDKFLFSAFSQWSAEETLNFFHSRGMDTKVEAEKRVFPVSNKAESVWNVLVENLKKNGVTVLSKAEVRKVHAKENNIESVELQNGNLIKARAFILATGGKSRPETGSTGDGFEWLKTLGHTVSEPSASLVPIALKSAWAKKIPGVSLQDIKITSLQNNEKQDVRRGKILFTHVGVTGPTVLNMSKDIGELLKYGEVELSLDVFPTLDPGALNLKLQEILRGETSNKKIKNSLSKLIPSGLVAPALELSKINPDTPSHSVTREERLALVQLLKNMKMEVKGLLGVDKAIITSGGVALEEIDFKTMRSRKYDNLHIIGDLLNIDRPSGGFSLQLCFTTGFVAGNAAGA